MEWVWPNEDQFNDYPDPIAFDAEWKDWRADLRDGPPAHAEIFAREYIQNSWDSIQTQNEQLRELIKNGEQLKLPQQNAVQFRFVKLTGKSLQTFVKNAGMDTLRDRYQAMSDKEKETNRLSDSQWLTATKQPTELKILICSEVGGLGMYGHWWTNGDARKKGSRLKYALIQSKSEKGDTFASGGSWGHGKKAVAGASSCRTLLVYTCFRPRVDLTEDQLMYSKRVLGVAYWKSHAIDNKSCTGAGVFGTRLNNKSDAWADNFFPLENSVADDFISGLGVAEIRTRDESKVEDHGSTYVIIEPSFSADELAKSIERNWWPLLAKRDGPKIEVVDENASDVLVKPSERTELAPFLRAYEVAANVSQFDQSKERKTDVSIMLKKKRIEVGVLVLTSDTSDGGWSYRDENDSATLTALIRGDMVIAYQPSPAINKSNPPYLRGIFLVDSKINSDAAKVLRLTEPHLHNEWSTKSKHVNPGYREAADAVLKKIHAEVAAFRESLRGEISKTSVRFSAFTNLFTSGSRGIIDPPPDPEPRLFSIQFPRGSNRLKGSSPTTLKLATCCIISLRPGTEKKPVPDLVSAKVFLSWAVLEDGKHNEVELINLSADNPSTGFKLNKKDGSYEGDLKKGSSYKFEWQSKEFSSDWSVAPNPIVEQIVLKK